MTADEPTSDGRTARRDRNRDAVLDAVLDLFGEDSLAPAPAEVAERSGVSLRSVYRYYEDRDALYRDVADHVVDSDRDEVLRFAHSFAPNDGAHEDTR